jgi:hypothetical protein
VDDLLARIRTRIQDPDRRVDVRTSAFSENVRSLDLGQLFSQGRSVAADLFRVVEANQAGRRLDPDLIAKAGQFGAAMNDPITPSLPPALDDEAIAAAEAGLGSGLPGDLRRLYTEVADGGFGPGGGLLRLAMAVEEYRSLRADPPGPRGQTWPEGLLPVVVYDPGYDGVDTATGAVISWDPEELTERSGDEAWRRTFEEVAPSVEAWMEAWVESKTLEERTNEQVGSSMVEQARASRAMIAAMTPEERAAMGLPEVGWESVVWGGLGLEDDDPP